MFLGIFLDGNLGILIVSRRHISNADGVVLNISGTYPDVYGNCWLVTEIVNGQKNTPRVLGGLIVEGMMAQGVNRKLSSFAGSTDAETVGVFIAANQPSIHRTGNS